MEEDKKPSQTYRPEINQALQRSKPYLDRVQRSETLQPLNCSTEGSPAEGKL